jgi:hypothetical protein
MKAFMILMITFLITFAMVYAGDKEHHEKRYFDHSRHMDNRVKQGDAHYHAGNYGQAARNYVSAAAI